VRKRSKIVSTNPNAAYERTSSLVLEVTSYGTLAQHHETIKGILHEIDLRGYQVKVAPSGRD
jgi:hypothetical protein